MKALHRIEDKRALLRHLALGAALLAGAGQADALA